MGRLANPIDTSHGHLKAQVIDPATDLPAEFGGGSGFLQQATIDLTAAQIATLNSVPVEVVAAQGAGTVIAIVGGSFEYKPGDVSFAYDPASIKLVDGVDCDVGSAGGTQVGLDLLGHVAVALLPVNVGNARPAYIQIVDGENLALSVTADLDPEYVGALLTGTITDAGTGYAPADTIELGINAGGTIAAVLTVDSVGGGGEVLTFTVTTAGNTSAVGLAANQAATSGAGEDFELTPDTITPLSDGTARLTVLWYPMELLP